LTSTFERFELRIQIDFNVLKSTCMQVRSRVDVPAIDAVWDMLVVLTSFNAENTGLQNVLTRHSGRCDSIE
jgi:hypothetical protein